MTDRPKRPARGATSVAAIRSVLEGSSIGDVDEHILTLKMQSCTQKIELAYLRYLKTSVFNKPDCEFGLKAQAQYQSILENSESQGILSYVWQKTCCPAEAIAAAGLVIPDDPRGLTVYSMAVTFNKNSTDLSAAMSRIRNIVMAAAAYELVEIDNLRKTKKLIRGTDKLNELMIFVNKRRAKTIISSLVCLLSLLDDTPDSDENQ